MELHGARDALEDDVIYPEEDEVEEDLGELQALVEEGKERVEAELDDNEGEEVEEDVGEVKSPLFVATWVGGWSPRDCEAPLSTSIKHFTQLVVTSPSYTLTHILYLVFHYTQGKNEKDFSHNVKLISKWCTKLYHL